MSRIYSRRPTRPGLTLIEVIVSLALLTTLLVVMLSAHDRHVRQIQTAREMISVTRSVDQLLYHWVETDKAIPRQANGVLPGGTEFFWKTHPLNERRCEALAVDVVRFEVTRGQGVSDDKPVFTVDLAVPAAPQKREE